MEQIDFNLGSDPELFLRDQETKELRSAIPIIPEGKDAGRALDSTGQNCVLHDNVLIEFNTKPATSKAEFVQTHGNVMRTIQTLVASSGLELHLQASANFPLSELTLPEARIFGCDPDFTYYPTPSMQIMPAEAADKPFRSAGGHLHIGVHENNPELTEMLTDPSGMGKIRVVKALDIFVGIVSVFLEKDPTAAERRTLYGKAGSHRPKTYGVEYRACSPWWLATPEHTSLVYDLTNAALSVSLEEEDLEDLIDDIGGESEIQDIINESKSDRAYEVFQSLIVPILNEETVALINTLHGQEEFDFYSAWNL